MGTQRLRKTSERFRRTLAPSDVLHRHGARRTMRPFVLAASVLAFGTSTLVTAQQPETKREGVWVGPSVRPLETRADEATRSLAELRRATADEPNPHLAFLPAEATPDLETWRERLALEARERRNRGFGLALEPGVMTGEAEPNDVPADATPVSGFGTGGGDTANATIEGVLEAIAIVAGASTEDDGSIDLANTIPLDFATQVQVLGSIGDGPHGSSGTGTGDFDFFEVIVSYPGQPVQIEAIDVTAMGPPLDTVIGVYDAAGVLLASNDDAGVGTNDSFLAVALPAGTFYVVVRGYGTGFPSDPFDEGSGGGVGDEGDYLLAITLADTDFFSVDLEAGDVLGVAATATPGLVAIHPPDESVAIRSQGDLSSIYPAASGLPGGTGGPVAHLVAPTAGTYTIELSFDVGAYSANLAVFRPPLEIGSPGDRQTLFFDFDGATVDPSIFGGTPGSASLSPLSSFLAAWGLAPGDESAVIDAILAVITENLETDLAGSGVNPLFDVEILNSRDHADPFGNPDVSRVIVGGTISELGISTIGIAESIDPGNFETGETGVVLLDLLSEVASNPNSLNQFSLSGGATKIDLVGRGVGNIASHEAGHFLANFHTDQFNALAAIMDQGGNLPNSVGTGGDTVFGNGDDVDVDFVADRFVPGEGFSGIEDLEAATAFGLSSTPAPEITVDPAELLLGLVGNDVGSLPLGIGNLLGTATLDWSVAESPGSDCVSPSDVAWLAVSSSSGSVPAGGSTSIDVDFDATGLGDGVYDATLCVTSNDVDTPLVEVPVELRVAPCGAIVLVLAAQTLNGMQAFEACETIVVGDGLIVGSGETELVAPQIVFQSGSSVASGAILRAGPPTPP